MRNLPIDSVLPDVLRAVQSEPIVVVVAPPGTGKTTRVAPFLMRAFEPDRTDQKLYLLQPRRLAAKSVAERMSQEDGSPIGKPIGYQVRFDNRTSRETRLIVATEGILLRRLQEDPTLQDTSIVVLDEFHERSLDADLLLGMLRRVQQTLREDLRIVIMSATLDTESLIRGLGSVPIIHVESPTYPVQIRYRPLLPQQKMVEHVVQTVLEVTPENSGDTLVFLPGAGEIHRAHEMLSRSALARDMDIAMLYGSLPLDEQTKIIASGPKRKVVLATNVAETSITIEGVRTVIDSGQVRVLRYSADVGIDRLALENISQASATQRAGRAGRVAPGVCYRLWSEAADRARATHLEPEIRRIDLASAILQLFAWGEGNSDDFPWLESPRSDAWASSRQVLECLGAIENNRVTELGKQMARIPLHPRLARLVLESMRYGCVRRVALMAAMLSERDPFDRRATDHRSSIHTASVNRWDSDCLERLLCVESFLSKRNLPTNHFGQLQHGAVRNIVAVADQILDVVSYDEQQERKERESHPTDGSASGESNESILRCLLAAYPDRLAKRRGIGKNNGVMVSGKGVTLAPQSGVADPELFLCIDVDAGRGDAVVRQASRVDWEWIADKVQTREEVFFHPTQKQVVARKQSRWIDLVLQETPTTLTDSEQAKRILFQAVLQHWDQAFPKDNDTIVGWIQRVQCLRDWIPELELPSTDQTMLESVAEELCDGRRGLSEIQNAPWLDWIRARFTNEQLQAVEKEAPAKVTLPSGRSATIQYEFGKPPVLAVKIQEVFSWKTTPRIARGRIPLLLHLLSPAMRPQQITDDLASFWANGYPEVKKELKRRYPKHAWPDDPANALPPSATRK